MLYEVITPAEVKKIAKETCKALVDVLPENKAVFSENLAKFEKEIDELRNNFV